MMASGSLVHRNGVGSVLASSTKRLIAACSDTSEWNAPRFSRRLVSLAKKPSTAFSQEVDDGVHQLAGRNHRLDGVEETDELLMPMALHAATNYVAVQHV